jgi:ABC-type multidrug transport system fused ATPase/permease subunit
MPNKTTTARPNKQQLANARQLLRYLSPHKWKFGAGMTFLFLSSSTTLAFPLLLGRLFDTNTNRDIHQLGWILLGIFAMNAVFSFFRIVLFEQVAQRSLAAIRIDVYKHIIALPMSFFSVRRVGELNSRISSDVSQLQSTFTSTLAEFLRQIITITGGVILLFTISGKLTLFMLGIVPVISVIAVFFGRFIRRLSKQTQEEVAAANTVSEETLQGIANVKAYTNEVFESQRYSENVQRVAATAIRTALYRGSFVSFIIFGLFGAIVGVIWYGLVLRGEGLISDGALFSFVLYTVFVGASIGGIAELYTQIIKALGATDNLMELMQEVPEEISWTDTTDTFRLSGHIRFEKVQFEYPSRPDIPVLRNLSFEVQPGEKVALVGASGAGKSTIVGILLGFYRPISGAVLLDGQDYNDISLTDMRRHMALVPQEVLLFGGSIGENIAYGKPGASASEIKEAARKANALEFIEKFPEGMQTVVGERGVQLSGGQRQRIAIARAILRNPSILILDEATSSLDSASEKLVQEAIDKLMEGRTGIVVAHRLSTIRNADKILVMDNGQLAESGTHSELIAKKDGVYARLLQTQDIAVTLGN